jgi:hypothetical protein
LTFNDPSLWAAVMSDYKAMNPFNLTYWQTYDGSKQTLFFYLFEQYLKEMTNVSSAIQQAFIQFYNTTPVALSINYNGV